MGFVAFQLSAIYIAVKQLANMENQWSTNKEAICQSVYLIWKGEHLYVKHPSRHFNVCFGVRKVKAVILLGPAWIVEVN